MTSGVLKCDYSFNCHLSSASTLYVHGHCSLPLIIVCSSLMGTYLCPYEICHPLAEMHQFGDSVQTLLSAVSQTSVLKIQAFCLNYGGFINYH